MTFLLIFLAGLLMGGAIGTHMDPPAVKPDMEASAGVITPENEYPAYDPTTRVEIK